MSLQFEIVPVTPFQQNCSILWCDQTMEGVVVDPGGDIERITARIDALGIRVVKIVLTHGHLDHVGGTEPLARQLDVPVWGPHQDDAFWLDALLQQCQMFGFPPVTQFQPDRWLAEGDSIAFGQQKLDVYHTPGHTPGHVVLHSTEAQLAAVGDVLFNGSIGRTDFPRGDHRTLIASIKNKLWPLGNETRFIPGHGPMSTFGEERASNPHVADQMPLY
ncbi:MBL fold metallo-hydrolase [Photobacterium sp. CCB-ST2H9]|uniref:MBL fold metallo-hydrolase n=1 Tax=unclassified Photobacterium TaxID=2628852 RepID=UPI0020048843|nr:MBL fold metallo-hydrolase [Photobacterium sp. CCB-ST2H9]UTM56167.1 MBL fold metallo-hydrolase [Photobacterium sp. CCB-ST2H9]